MVEESPVKLDQPEDDIIERARDLSLETKSNSSFNLEYEDDGKEIMSEIAPQTTSENQIKNEIKMIGGTKHNVEDKSEVYKEELDRKLHLAEEETTIESISHNDLGAEEKHVVKESQNLNFVNIKVKEEEGVAKYESL